jgi:hypothetical protein
MPCCSASLSLDTMSLSMPAVVALSLLSSSSWSLTARSAPARSRSFCRSWFAKGEGRPREVTFRGEEALGSGLVLAGLVLAALVLAALVLAALVLAALVLAAAPGLPSPTLPAEE